MTKHEKVILIFVVLIFISSFTNLAKGIYIAQLMALDEYTRSIEVLFKTISPLIYSLTNIAAAIWLYIEAKEAKLKAWVWALFGLFAGLFSTHFSSIKKTMSVKYNKCQHNHSFAVRTAKSLAAFVSPCGRR
ncbi:MAG: hypothetical protein MK096_04015 [Oleiphilaceae bacterium]|nr:hypothetical protein [Oleiphilaceae bacterium]